MPTKRSVGLFRRTSDGYNFTICIARKHYVQNNETFQVTELNIFAQKSVDWYRGFAQFYTHPFGGPSTESRSCDSGQEGAPVAPPVLLCELLVQLPKVSTWTHHVFDEDSVGMFMKRQVSDSH